MVEPCPWQMLLPTQPEGEAEAVPAGSGGCCSARVPAMSVPMHFRSVICPSPARWDRAGGPAAGWDRAVLGVGPSPVPPPGRGFSAALGLRDTFCMRLGVFGVVVSVGDAIALFSIEVRSKGRLDVLLL